MTATPAWNTYGGNAAHTRVYTGREFDGQLHSVYSRATPGLMEFPPTYHAGVGYVATDSGSVLAFKVSDGATIWRVSIGGVAADSPTWSNGKVFVQSRGAGATGLAALSAATGKVAWRHTGFTGESTPTAYGSWICGADTAGVVGCWGDDNGLTKWSVATGCKITGSLARSGNSLYAADYCGRVWRRGAEHGALIWQASVGGAVYANVAVAAGRVIVDDRATGYASALSAASGSRIWRTFVGADLYAAPAVTADAVYTASRGGVLAKINVSTGALMWRSTVAGLVMGSPVVVGGRVLYSVMGANFTPGQILGYSTSGMKRSLTFTTDGRYSPAIVAGSILLLIGQTHIYAMEG